MSEVIRDFIKHHESLSEDAAFKEFLHEERIRSWVGSDTQRREKIQQEFSRLWADHHGKSPRSQRAVQVQTPDAPTDDPRVHVTKGGRIGPAVATVPIGQPATSRVGFRHLQLLCPSCNHLEVYTKGHLIECRKCGRQYDNMLELIPVQPVGPFAYMFGEGLGGVATAVGLVVLLLIIYGVFRWA